MKILAQTKGTRERRSSLGFARLARVSRQDGVTAWTSWTSWPEDVVDIVDVRGLGRAISDEL